MTAVKALKSIGLFAVVESFLFLSVGLSIFCPIPIIVAYHQHGKSHAIATTLVTIFIVGFVFNSVTPGLHGDWIFRTLSVLFLLGLSIIGLTIGHGLRSNWSFIRLFNLPVLCICVLTLVGGGLYYGYVREGIPSFLSDFRIGVTALQERIQTSQQGPNELADELEKLSNLSDGDLFRLIRQHLPLSAFWGLSLITAILVHCGIYVQLLREWKKLGSQSGQALGAALSRGRAGFQQIPQTLRPWIRRWKDTFYWRAPDHLIYLWIGSGLLALTPFTPLSKEIGILLFNIVGTFYCLQGFSLFHFVLELYRIPGFIRFGFYALLFLLPNGIGIYGLMALGVVDFWADFRKKTMKLGEVT